MIWAFVIGGVICTIGQAILNLYKYFGLDQIDASGSVSVTLIFVGALLTGLKIYDNIAKRAGAGSLVPITGFANSIVAPALEFKSEGFILGMSAKMFVIAGPVLVFGISASIIYGLILWIFKLF
jgi:stage V sporulation protein AC